MLSGPTDDVGAGYDGARRIIDFSNKGSAPTPLPEFTYGYDPAGNRTFERRIHESAGTCGTPPENCWKGESFGYDAVYRLVSRKEGSLNSSGVMPGTPTSTVSFSLDGLGNWKSQVNGSKTYTNTINSLNQYDEFNQCTGMGC